MIARAVLVVRRRDGGLEPFVLVRRVVGHDVDEHLQTQLVSTAEQAVKILESAVLGIDAEIVGHVVPVVFLW